MEATVPVAIAGAAAPNSKKRPAMRPGTIRVAIGEPLNHAGSLEKVALLREVRRRFSSIARLAGWAVTRRRPVLSAAAPAARALPRSKSP